MPSPTHNQGYTALPNESSENLLTIRNSMEDPEMARPAVRPREASPRPPFKGKSGFAIGKTFRPLAIFAGITGIILNMVGVNYQSTIIGSLVFLFPSVLINIVHVIRPLVPARFKRDPPTCEHCGEVPFRQSIASRSWRADLSTGRARAWARYLDLFIGFALMIMSIIAMVALATTRYWGWRREELQRCGYAGLSFALVASVCHVVLAIPDLEKIRVSFDKEEGGITLPVKPTGPPTQHAEDHGRASSPKDNN